MNNNKPYNNLPLLPVDLRKIMNTEMYKKVIQTNKELAKLNGIELMNNRKISEIFLHSLVITESIDSNIIENINTTIDSVSISSAIKDIKGSEKETLKYKEAMLYGLDELKKNNILSLNTIIGIQEKIEDNNAGIRKVPGTKLENEKTGEVVYFPPDPTHLEELLNNLEQYINNDELDSIDNTIKSAIIHYQFESIHPFLDGNGRTGRILILLFLIKQNLLSFPILFISGYINQNKADYYRLLQEVRTNNNWEEYIHYILDGIEKQAKITGEKILNINKLYKEKSIKIGEFSNLKGKEKLLDLLFQRIYISFGEILKNLDISKPTLIKKLAELKNEGVIAKLKDGKNTIYYIEEYLNILKK